MTHKRQRPQSTNFWGLIVFISVYKQQLTLYIKTICITFAQRLKIMLVKKIAKYLTLLLLVVIAALGYAYDRESLGAETLPTQASTELTTTFIDSSAHNGSIAVSHNTLTPHTIQLQGATKRTNNAHKNNFEYIAAGKAINVCIENYIFKKSATINTSFTKSGHRLIRLGKLII